MKMRMMRQPVNFFTDEIDGRELSREQSTRIENIFDKLKDNSNVLDFQVIIDLLGHYAPDVILKRLFSSHKQTTSEVNLKTLKQFFRFLLNGTKQDKIRALSRYYTFGHLHVSLDDFREILEQEEWSVEKLGSLIKKDVLSYDRLNELFTRSPAATNMSTWLLDLNFTLASRALNLPSKACIMSISTGIDEETLREVSLEFKRIATCDKNLIDQSSFRESLTDFFPDSFIAGLFKYFDVNNDGYIDEMEFYNGLNFLPRANKADSKRRIFQMFSSQTQDEASFSSTDFDSTLRHFVPPLVLHEPSSKMSEVLKCTSLSEFTAWAANNPAFLHFVEFLKALMHVVFGLPLPPSESETSKVIILWLYYMIVKRCKHGSQWYIISSRNWPSLAMEGLKLGLKIPSPHETYDLYHPVSMYEELFNGSPISNTSMSLKRTSMSERTRRFSVAERGIEKPSRHHFRLRGSTKSKSPNHEQKLPKKAGRVMSHHYQQRKYSRSATLPSNSPLEGDTTLYSGDAKSREDVRLCAQTLEKNLMLEEALQSPFIAVDKRLAERLQHQSVINTDPIGINKKRQLSPSYLILYAPVQDASEAEAMELHPLQICVRWTVGCRPKVSPTTRLVIDTGVPKKPRFCAPSFMPSENMRSVKKRSVSRVEKPDLKPTWRERKYSRASKSSILTRSTSVPGKRDSILSPDCIYVLPKKLSEQCLRFAFSRCHTILEVCEVIARNFSDYCNHDLTTDSYRLWFVDSPESVDSPSQRPKMSQITKTVSVSSDTTDSDDDEGDSSSGGTLLAKRVCLAPINPNVIGGRQLGRFLADQDPSSQVCADIFDPYGKCPKTFEFVIECLQQNYYWPLGQCPNEAGNFVGLKNMGNTCYFNSVIQCLRATPYLERQIRMRVTPQNKLANEYVKLLDQMKQERWVNPRSLRQVFVQKMPAFEPFVQQDAHEFLTLFIDLLNEELKHKPTSPKNGTLRSEDNRKRSVYTKKIFSASKQNVFRGNTDSPITSIFSGLCESQCQFDECRHNSSSFDIFASLTLPLSVDEVSYIILTVVPSHDAVPEMVRFENDRPITFNFIRQQVSRRYKCSLDQVFLALYNDKALTPLLPSSTESEKVVSKFDYWAFILPPSRPGSPIDKEMLVVVQNRILVPSSSPLLEEVPDEREVLGSPIVLLLPLNTTNKELYNIVEKAINRYHQPNDGSNNKPSNRIHSTSKYSNPGDEKFFFVLKQTGQHLWRCSKCRWPKMCRGCPIPYNSEKVSFQPSANGCAYIAADWSLDVYINEYRQAQDVIWKKIDKVGHTGSNSKDALQLTNLLRKFFEEEVVNKSDSILCDLCHKKESFTMYTNICELPEILLISFKRFHATNHGWRKSSNLVDFPLTSLDMRAYLSKDVNCDNTLYDLYAVVNHTGKLDEGHYYAFIRNVGGHWFRVNDTQFSEVRKESVVTSDAYILFYQQRQSG